MIYKVRMPTNIAFLKYWGKSDEDQQWPTNDSLSMTLDLYTETFASLSPVQREKADGVFEFSSDQDLGSCAPFLKKALKHLKFLSKELNFPQTVYIQSANEFPAGCGIASSASGLASLTLASLAAWTSSSTFEELESHGFSRERIAHLSRMGSGSAGRSLWGGFVEWTRGLESHTQSLSQVFPSTHWNLRDCVLIVSDSEKAISSTEGHKLASTSPIFATRLMGLPGRLQRIKEAIAQKDMNTLGPLLEEEALEMHEVMASSNPPCVYMTASTFDLLEFLVRKRNEFKIPFYFTLDAGPNVHVIYEESYREKLKELFKDYRSLDVAIGSGPILEVHHA